MIPIVLIVYKRKVSLELMKAIRVYKPNKIFLISDGPKTNNEAELCRAAIMSVLDQIDWKCKIVRVYSRTHLGLRSRVVSGLNFVFNRVKWAIILEDDLLVHRSFFIFAEMLLKKYEYMENIISISGNNFQFDNNSITDSYYFSRYVHSWGWATWRRSWKLYNDKLAGWKTSDQKKWLKKVFNNKLLEMYWYHIFNLVDKNRIDSWAYRWTYTALKNNGLTIIPKYNLISNIGYGKSATHTIHKSKTMGMKIRKINYPLSDPKFIVRNSEADKVTEKNIYINFLNTLSLLLRYIIK